MKKSLSAQCFKLLILLALFSLILSISACGKSTAKPDKYSFYESVMDTSKPIAWGDDRDIYVFCDEADWKLAQDMLKRSLEREVAIVVNERYFNLIRADIKDIDQMIKYKNLLFLGDLQSKAAVSAHVRSTMPKQMIERVENTGAEMFVSKNRWVKDQVVVYIVGSNRENLLKLNILHSNKLFTLFLNRFGERLAYQAYQTKVIPEDFFQPYPFTIKLPENYRVYVNDQKNRFLSFLYRINSESRDFPDKYISVYYQNMQTDSLNLEWILTKRKELASNYYDKDEFDPELLRSEKVTFAGYSAWRLIGPWKNLKHDIGGGFQTFAFYDAKQKKAFLIDNVVYYPAGDKLPQLLEMQKLSLTFKAK
jgi:hypothetical protein